MKFHIDSSVPKKEKLLHSLQNNKALQEALARQCLYIHEHQILCTNDVRNHCFKIKKLSYYNFVEFNSFVLNKKIEAYMPICIQDIEYNEKLRTRLFVRHILSQKFFSAFGICSEQLIKQLQHVETLQKAVDKIKEYVDSYLNTVQIVSGRKMLEDYTFCKQRLLLIIDMLSERIPKQHSIEKYSIPFLSKINKNVQKAVGAGAYSRANCSLVPVYFTYYGIRSKFTILYSLCDIEAGERLYHSVKEEEQVKIKKNISKKWPWILQINMKLFVPNELFYVPILYNGKIVNFFEFVATQMVLPKEKREKLSFQLPNDLKHHYTEHKLDTDKLTPTYNLIQCVEEKKTIRILRYVNFNYLDP